LLNNNGIGGSEFVSKFTCPGFEGKEVLGHFLHEDACSKVLKQEAKRK
jgi:hypothetical protein